MLCLWRFFKLSFFSSFVAVLASKRVTPKRPILHCAFDHRTTSCQKQNKMQIHVVTFLPIFLCAQTPVVTRSAWRQCFSFTRQATRWTSRSLEAQWSRMQSTVETSYAIKPWKHMRLETLRTKVPKNDICMKGTKGLDRSLLNDFSSRKNITSLSLSL